MKELKRFGIPLLALLLAGCPVKTNTGSMLISNNSAKFAGTLIGPTNIISNNSAKLISNNSSKYQVLDFVEEELPLKNALLYLGNLKGQHYAKDDGTLFVTSSNEKGQFSFPQGPLGEPVMINAIVENNQRLSGYTFPTEQGKEYKVDISLASTYNAEFFRWKMKDKTNDELKQVKPETLTAITAETNSLLAAKKLGIPDLTMGAAARMCNAYAAAFNKTLSDLWTQVIGTRPIPITTFAGNFMLGSGEKGKLATETKLTIPAGIAQDASGQIFLAMRGEHKIRIVTTDGRLDDYAGKFEGDPSEYVPAPNLGGLQNGILRTEASLPSPMDLDIDEQGNLFWTCFTGNDLADGHFIWMLCRQAGTYYGIPMEQEKVYRLGGGTDGTAGFLNGALANAKFRFPWGLCLDKGGNIYVADRLNNAVRKIARNGGNVSTLVGDPNTWETWTPTPVEQLGDGSNLAAGRLARPFDVAWRENGGTQELFILDGHNNRIRKIVSSDNFATGTLSTLAGGSWGHQDGPLATAKFALPAGTATEPNVAETGLSLSNNRLFVTELANQTVRMIDLDAGTVSTIAGGGWNDRDGLASDARLLDVSYPYMLPNGPYKGSVLLSESSNHAVRRINTQWGF